MQSETVLQPNASGTGDTSAEPEKTGFTSFWDEYYNSVGNAPIVNTVNYNSVPKVTSIYKNPDDQKLYRALREEGRTAAEAREALLLMGVKPATESGSSSTVPDWFWDSGRKEKKVDFPFYHHKRKH